MKLSKYLPLPSTALLLCCITAGGPAEAAKTDVAMSAKVDAELAKQDALDRQNRPPPTPDKLAQECESRKGGCHFKIHDEQQALVNAPKKEVVAYKTNCGPLTSTLSLEERTSLIDELETSKTETQSIGFGAFASFLNLGVNIESSTTIKRTVTNIKETMNGIEEPICSGCVTAVILNAKVRKAKAHYEFDTPFEDKKNWSEVVVDVEIPEVRSQNAWLTRHRCMKPDELKAFCQDAEEPQNWTEDAEQAFKNGEGAPPLGQCTLDIDEAVASVQEADTAEAPTEDEAVEQKVVDDSSDEVASTEEAEPVEETEDEAPPPEELSSLVGDE
ncbi:hypothetical protein ACLESO_05750 [Pyxidicoccus sp. 3LG]